MESDVEIPCATCVFWNPKKKSLDCDPNRCKRLSDWLMKHDRGSIFAPQKKIVQYIV